MIYKEDKKEKSYSDGFDESKQKQHLEQFKNWLGSCTRYLSNKRMKEQKYHG